MTLITLHKQPKGTISKFLSQELGETIKVHSLEKLGEGCHGVAYKAITTSGKTFILKQFKEDGRNMEFAEDRIREAHLIKRTANNMENHVKIHHVAYLHKETLQQLPEEEPIIIMEEVEHDEYFNDLTNFGDVLTSKEKIRIQKIASYLAQMHLQKQPEKVYTRYLKDWYSHGILELVNEMPSKKLKLKQKFLEWEHKLHNKTNRCVKIHGEFFPGTIHFSPTNNLQTYDMRRFGAGEAADDVGSMLFNYYAFPLQQYGKITPTFQEAAELFLNTYLKERKDKDILNYLPCFMAYRCLILANPNIIPMKSSSRKKIQKFLWKLLEMKKFQPITESFIK